MRSTALAGVRLKAVGHVAEEDAVRESGPKKTHGRLSNGIVTVCGKPVLSP